MSVDPEPQPPRMLIDRQLISRLFFFGTFAFLLYQLGRIFWPFLTTLMAAATLVFVFQPVHRRIHRFCGGRDSLAAILGTILLLSLIILPALAAAWLLAGEASAAIPVLKAWVQRFQEGGAESVVAARSTVFPVSWRGWPLAPGLHKGPAWLLFPEPRSRRTAPMLPRSRRGQPRRSWSSRRRTSRPSS